MQQKAVRGFSEVVSQANVCHEITCSMIFLHIKARENARLIRLCGIEMWLYSHHLMLIYLLYSLALVLPSYSFYYIKANIKEALTQAKCK